MGSGARPVPARAPLASLTIVVGSSHGESGRDVTPIRRVAPRVMPPSTSRVLSGRLVDTASTGEGRRCFRTDAHPSLHLHQHRTADSGRSSTAELGWPLSSLSSRRMLAPQGGERGNPVWLNHGPKTTRGPGKVSSLRTFLVRAGRPDSPPIRPGSSEQRSPAIPPRSPSREGEIE